jgi:hypothetical protein
VRLQYDTTANDTNPSVSGVIRWHTTESMLQEFRKQLTSYEKGLVQPVEIARMLNPTEAARLVGTMTWAARDENNWSLDDGPALVKHIAPDQSFVRDEVSRVRETLRRPLGRILDRESTMQLCNLLYDGIKRHRFGYETEQRTSDMSTQRIRSPMQIATHRTGTCIDMACLFASMLESAGQNPLIAVIAGPRFSHALVGYHVRGEPSWEGISKADVQAAFKRRDAVFFEATGAVEADEPIGSEFANERHNKLLTFVDAISAAERIFDRDDVSLKHFVEIRKRTVRT